MRNGCSTQLIWGWELELGQQQTIATGVDQWITGIPGRMPDRLISFVRNAEPVGYPNELAGQHFNFLLLDGGRGVGTVIHNDDNYQINSSRHGIARYGEMPEDVCGLPYGASAGITSTRTLHQCLDVPKVPRLQWPTWTSCLLGNSGWPSYACAPQQGGARHAL